MLCYALDIGLLPDDCHQALSDMQNAEQLPLDMPWLLGLYWARRFYESGRGNDYLSAIGESGFHQSQRAQAVFRTWNLKNRFPQAGNKANLYALLSECWLITGDDGVGTDSKLWRALSAIVEEVPENCDEDDVMEAIARLEDEGIYIPIYLAWRAENGPWLAQSIRAIKTGGGDGWLGVIGKNPFWQDYRQRDNATCAWGLRKDGNRVQWAIRIANVRLHANSSIKITQSNRTLLECKGERHVSVSELGPDYDPANPLIIRAGNRRLDLENLPPCDPARPLLFRKSRSSSFHRLISSRDNNQEEGAEHIQASRLFLLPPTGQNGNAAINFGNQPIQSAYAGQVAPDVYGPSLYELSLDNCDRAEPLWLTWNGTNLLQIGGKPCLSATNVAEGFALRGHPEVFVVFGSSTVLSVANLSQNHEDPAWRIEGGHLQDTADGKAMTPDAMGTIVKAACMIGNTRCQTRLIFLPEALRAAATALDAAEGDGWTWIPEQDEYKKCAAAENGRVRGRARTGPQADNEGWAIESASLRPLWWWRSGIGGVWTTFCSQREDITDLTDLQNKCLLVHIPIGVEATLCLNNQPLPGAVLGEGLTTLPVFGLLRDAVNFNELGCVATLSLRYDGEIHQLAKFLSYPADPMLVRMQNGPVVFFPDPPRAASYHVAVVRDSALLTGTIQIIGLNPGNVVRSNCICLEFDNCMSNEGCWMVLRPNGGIGQQTLLQLAWELRDHTAGQGTVLQVQPSCPVTPVPSLLQQWNGDQDLTGQQVATIQQIAAFINGGNSTALKVMFERFLRHEEFNSMAGNATAATNYFEKHMEGHFAIADLLEPLSRLLHMGFNWLAEPNWISGKEIAIESRYRNPDGAGRRNWNNRNGVTSLIESIPIIPALTDIEAGYPYGFRQERVPELKEIATLAFNGQGGPLHGGMEISFDNTAHRLHGVYREGLRGHGNFRFPAQNNQNQCLDFQYHGQRALCGVWSGAAQHYVRAPYTTRIVDDSAAIGHFVNQDPMDDLPEAIFEDGNARPSFDQIFNAALMSASPVIDRNDIKGLCYLFQTCGLAFQKIADEQPSQINRSLIFQVAVLNALNRWLGWNGSAYPEGWPLSERANADLLCGLTARIWDIPVARITLMQDQIPTEWLLAWFHNSPNA